jgi:hypothetical protein
MDTNILWLCVSQKGHRLTISVDSYLRQLRKIRARDARKGAI